MKLREMAARVSAALTRHRIPHVLVGGLAVAARGKPRYTRDVDFVVYPARPDQAAALVRAIEDAGLVVEQRNEKIRRLRKLKPVKMAFSGDKSVDLRIGSTALDASSLRRATPVLVEDQGVPTTPAEELVAYKLARYEEYDPGDIQNVIERQGRAFDWERLWTLAIRHADEVERPAIRARFVEVAGRFRLPKLPR